jgi:hypothetical protein
MNLQQKFVNLQDELKELLEEARKEGFQEGVDSVPLSAWGEGYSEALGEVSELLGPEKRDLDTFDALKLVLKERDEFREDKERLDWAIEHGVEIRRANPTEDLRKQIDWMRIREEGESR